MCGDCRFGGLLLTKWSTNHGSHRKDWILVSQMMSFGKYTTSFLRHLGDLKKLYASMRKMIQRTTDDPWLVYMFHMWILAREAGILAPDCSLARLNRRMVCGPRQHGEAFPEDVPDLRPLTPRQVHATGKHEWETSACPAHVPSMFRLYSWFTKCVTGIHRL